VVGIGDLGVGDLGLDFPTAAAGRVERTLGARTGVVSGAVVSGVVVSGGVAS
jgi:hypothetical protein